MIVALSLFFLMIQELNMYMTFSTAVDSEDHTETDGVCGPTIDEEVDEP
jgi:hypothetical protein